MNNGRSRPPTPGPSAQQTHEGNVEETLLDDILELVRRYMTRPSRTHSYDASMEWRICSDSDIFFQVSIKIVRDR